MSAFTTSRPERRPAAFHPSEPFRSRTPESKRAAKQQRLNLGLSLPVVRRREPLSPGARATMPPCPIASAALGIGFATGVPSRWVPSRSGLTLRMRRLLTGRSARKASISAAHSLRSISTVQGREALGLMPLRSGDDEINLAAAAVRSIRGVRPIWGLSSRAVARGRLAGIGLDLPATLPTPRDHPHTGRRGITKGRRAARYIASEPTCCVR